MVHLLGFAHSASIQLLAPEIFRRLEPVKSMSKDCVHIPLRYPWDIRVVLLQSGEGEEMIRCDQKVICAKDVLELHDPGHASSGTMVETVPYIALSYCWGDPSVTLPILLNGRSFQVTVNLHSFLQHFRQSQMVSVLWIDAICVDQGDATERSNMVRRMKSIYEYAKQVLIWLGPASDDSSLAIAKIYSVANMYASAKTQLEMQGIPSEEAGIIARDVITKKGPAGTVMQSLAAPYDGDPWTALECLFERPWWSRLWIIQEATTQVDTMIVCGNHMMDWKVLLCALALFYHLSEKAWFSSLKQETLAGPIRLINLRHTRHSRPQDLRMLSMFHDFSKFGATDARDKIYAVLGLAVDYDPRGDLKIDYTKTLREVYIDTAKHSILSSTYGHHFDIFGILDQIFFLDGERSSDDLKLPSWVPDFRYPQPSLTPFHKYKSTPGVGSREGSNEMLYFASGKSPPSAAANLPLITIIDEVLRMQGFLIDYVEKIVGAVPRGGNDLTLSVTDVFGWKPENPEDIYFTGETVAAAYLRTVVADIKYEDTLPVSRGNFMNPTALKPVNYLNKNVSALMSACEDRIFAWTKGGLMGLVPEHVRPGDQIYLLLGGQVLYALRPVGDHFRVLGECYIHGHMNGDILKEVSLGLRQFREIAVH